jgi:hypothetical protein
LLLIFLLILADRTLKKVVPKDGGQIHWPGFSRLTEESARYVFQNLPHDLWHLITDYRTLIVLAGLFLLKQLISLWPSSDMRRMHRNERGVFGIFTSLVAIRWEQVLWDAIAVSSICGFFAVWSAFGYAIAKVLWQMQPATILLMVPAAFVAVFLPLGMAGFSFSSKLAVLSRGTFAEKLDLFLRLVYSRQVLLPSWIFFSVRLGFELIFVVLIPLIVLYTVNNFWIRILTATLLATPVYSYLKMASFKFFLEVYRPFALVRQEFNSYYRSESQLK